MKAKINLKNIIAYIQGNIRYCLYYSKFAFVIPKHIREQIDFRIKSMREICYKQGYCEECGCKTTHLQMADKTCDGVCYPVMLNKRYWKSFKKCGVWMDKKNRIWKIEYNKFIRII